MLVICISARFGAVSAAGALSFLARPPPGADRGGGGAAGGADGAPKGSSGEGRIVRVPLTNFKGSMYYGEVLAGTPPQRFTAMFATGSADSWLPSKGCLTAPCKTHARFAEAYSSSFRGPASAAAAGDASLLFNLTYSLGSLAGLPGNDTVRLGGGGGMASASGAAESGGGGDTGGEEEPLVVRGASFGRVVRQDEKFQSQYRWLPFDGIVGLSYAGASVSRQRPLFDALMASGRLRKNVFSLYLTQGEGTPGSQLILGGTDPKLHLDEVAFFPVERPHVFWSVNVSRVALVESYAAAASPLHRRVLATLCAPEQHHLGCRAVVDSGTSLISGPTAAIERLREHIRVDESCGNADELPVLSFQFYGKTFSLHPADYVVRVPVGDSHACFLGLEAQDFPEQMGPMWVLGNVFLRKFYTVFDRDNDLVGFAMARPA